jgi:hypothetical protein
MRRRARKKREGRERGGREGMGGEYIWGLDFMWVCWE